MDLLNIFRQALDGVRDQRQAAQAEIERLKRRRHELNTLPLPRADFINAMLESIDRRAAAWASDRLPQTIASYLTTPDAVIDVPLLESHGAYSKSGQVFPDVLYGLLAPELKAALRSKIEAMPWPAEVGPARQARRTELEKVNRDLAALEAQLKQIIRDARAAGVDLDALEKART